MKECLKKRDLVIREARRMGQNNSVQRGFVREDSVGSPPGDEPLTLTRYHSCELPQLYETLEGWRSICGQTTA